MNELNILKILKNLKNLKILMKNKFLDEDTKFQIKHNHKNLINLDSSSSECSNDDAHCHGKEKDGPDDN